MQALSLDDVLEFANAHCQPGLNNALPASQLRHSLKTVPIFAADGQSVRLKGTQDKLLKRSVLQRAEEGGKAALVRSELKRKSKAKPVGPPPTAGKQWFDVPNTPLTPEIEKTFKWVLELRPYMYKDRHYKRTAKSEIPEFFAMGTVVDDARDFYSSRVPKKQRKQSLADELLDDPNMQRYVERKAGAIKAKAEALKQVRQRKNSRKMRPRVGFATKRPGKK